MFLGDDEYSKLVASQVDFAGSGNEIAELERYLRGQIVYGEELWLDLLIGALDREKPGKTCLKNHSSRHNPPDFVNQLLLKHVQTSSTHDTHFPPDFVNQQPVEGRPDLFDIHTAPQTS